jgi:integrase/recombinase XerD
MTNLNPTLQDAAKDYLALRRSFGYRLRGHDRPLADFVHHLDQAGLDRVTVESAMAWAVEPAVSSLRHAQRLSIARGFATYLHALDPRCEVPPKGLLPEGRRRVPPHIYTADEIAELMAQSRRLQPPLRSATLETVIGLLVVTGMRSGEAVRLNRGDVDLVAGRVSIIATKFNKSRELALHPTTVQALEGYGRLRDRRWPRPATMGFFVSSTGRRLSQGTLEQTFAQLVRRAGLEPPSGSRARRPRLHDARHSFAVATLIRWYRTGQDVQALLPALSAQLGHVDPASTYWYLTAVPELLALASERVQVAREVSR